MWYVTLLKSHSAETSVSWARNISARVQELHQQGVPAVLKDLSATNRPSSEAISAAEFINKALEQMSKKPLPLIPTLAESKTAKTEISADAWGQIKLCVDQNQRALELLAEANQFDQARFSFDLEKGFAALLPHLPKVKRACQLLGLEAIFYAHTGETNQAWKSLRTCIHLANLVDSGALSIEYSIRIGGVQSASSALNICLQHIAFSKDQILTLINDFKKSCPEKRLQQLLISERCEGFEVFLGDNASVVDFFEATDGALNSDKKQELARSLILMKKNGIWERDGTYFLKTMDLFDSLIKEPITQRYQGLSAIKPEIETNRRFRSGAITSVNIISDMLLPSVIKFIEKSDNYRAILDVTVAALAIEHFRLSKGSLPRDWSEISSDILTVPPQDVFRDGHLTYQQSNPGFKVETFLLKSVDESGKVLVSTNRISFSVYR